MESDKKSSYFLLLFFFVLLFSFHLFSEDHALLIGIDSYGDSRVPPTPGCVADAVETAKFIKAKFNFPESSIKLLLNEKATARNIKRVFKEWLINGTQPGDRVFFLYAGHGSQLPDDNNDEQKNSPGDKYDETIAPYDVNPSTGANQIRDDKFEELISQLSGRRAVMIFDSCHSGTITRGITKNRKFPKGGGVRYLPTPEQFNKLQKTYSGSRSYSMSYVVKENKGRDLSIEAPIMDKRSSKNLSGIVVISAAKSNQTAWPIEVDGSYRGALSYVFANVQKYKIPKFRDLKYEISNSIKQLHKSGELNGEQEPVFEMISTINLDDFPIFATWEQVPELALHNPFSSIKLSIRTTDGKTFYTSNDTISYEVTSDVPGYLYLLVFGQNHHVDCIFPNSVDFNNRIPAGSFNIPTNNSYEFEVYEPFGRDVTVAILSKERLNLGDKDGYTWDEVFQRLNLKGFQKSIGNILSRGQRISKKNNYSNIGNWQAAAIILEKKR